MGKPKQRSDFNTSHRGVLFWMGENWRGRHKSRQTDKQNKTQHIFLFLKESTISIVVLLVGCRSRIPVA